MTDERIKLGKYMHFKGGVYEFVGECMHTETMKPLVLYKSLQGSDKYPAGTIWARPKAMFLDKVMYNNEEIPRFKYITNE